MKSFEIDRATWVNGGTQNRGESQLLNSSGFKCCLGFCGEACGIDRNDLENHGSPAGADNSLFNWPEWMLLDVAMYDDSYKENSAVTSFLIRINDAKIGTTIEDYEGYNQIKITSEAHREFLIAFIFWCHGIDVTFVN